MTAEIEFQPWAGGRFAAIGPAEAMEVGQEVLYRRASDGAEKRYRLVRIIWEGEEDGKPMRAFATEYIRKSERHPMGRCWRCRMPRRTNKMRCSGNGFYCSPVISNPHTP
jgi:hypothetical protein